MKKARQKKEKEVAKQVESHEEHHETEEGGEEFHASVDEAHSTESHEGDKTIYQTKFLFYFVITQKRMIFCTL